MNKKLLFWALFILFLIFELISGKEGLYNLWKLKKEKIIYTKKIETLRKENKRLMTEIYRLRNDPEYIEAVIKKEMKMIGKDEIIVYFGE